ncbi:hypothetical protein GA0074694_2775 [Micromonospora inyonensis]|uniref:Uncharacterized protein n=1 Tax=Micromonospora inyonensis TaxID=47866 RepID=A0A1C6RRK7_9ACTN|nr:hypothetical protein GA0074694_2775 [Micromonospora inyonensis]
MHTVKPADRRRGVKTGAEQIVLTETEDAGHPPRTTPDPVRRSDAEAGTAPSRVPVAVAVPAGGRTAPPRAVPGGRHRAPRRAWSAGSVRLLVIYGWATGLGAVALASGVRGLVLVLAGTAPQWYQPTVAALGFGGIALGGVALHGPARPGLRWAALGLANLAVGVSAGLTASLP